MYVHDIKYPNRFYSPCRGTILNIRIGSILHVGARYIVPLPRLPDIEHLNVVVILEHDRAPTTAA
jgi:hypothetical protein